MSEARPAAAMRNRLADEKTPLIRDAWYVAAISAELSPGRLLARKIAGQGVVLYRKADGTAVALKDRCPHRAYPLSDSRLEGDDIVCGYHGFRYGPSGSCIHVPSMSEPPKGIRARSYPIVEQAPLVWIWMGDPARGADTPVPAHPWMYEDNGWARSPGYLQVACNYVHLHENLLDLSHLSFLHATTFGTPDYASAPFEVKAEGSDIHLYRRVAPTSLPPIYARPLNLEGKPAARIVTSSYVSPGMQISAVVLQDLTKPEGERTDHHIRTAQLLTPADQDSLHYFFLIGRDFACDDEATSHFIHGQIVAVFNEDKVALEKLTQVRRDDPDEDAFDTSVPADKAGVALRRHFRELAEQEAGRKAVG